LRIGLSVARSRSALSIILLLGSVLLGCSGDSLVLPGDEPPSGEPVAIRVLTGDGQSGEVGTLLAAPVVVEVTDAEGQPVANATVTFALTSAGEGAEIQPASATTDAAGHAEARVVLGSKVGLQTGEASVAVVGTVVPKTFFSAIATPDTPTPEPSNQPPRSEFEWSCDNLTCQFTDASTDHDGVITGRTWRFGDGATAAATNPSHIYPAAGSYTVMLTVTDDDGATDESSVQVNVSTPPPPGPNKAPDADFDVHCSGLTCAFVDKSKDDDGAVVGWQWNFGDGATSSERNPVHTYAEEGKYDVLLTVTDDDGAADAKDREVDAKD
jgi:PKD repeat protein